MAWKVETQSVSTGTWYTDRLLFETEAEAEAYSGDIARTQPGILGLRLTEVKGAEANYARKEGRLDPIPGKTLS